MGLRRKGREFALQFLFGHDFQEQSCAPENVQQELILFRQNFDVEEKSAAFGEDLIMGICAHHDEIDALITAHSKNWRLTRMPHVDRNILRIAVYEMHFCEQTPAQVAINEALEIAKRYATGDSVAFINGILDAVQSSFSM